MIDKRLLQDTINVRKVQEKNDFGDLAYSAPFTVKSVRFDRNISDKGVNNSKSRDKTGTIFIYPSISKVDVDKSWLEATINDGSCNYIVKSIQPNYLNGKLFSYEIGVV